MRTALLTGAGGFTGRYMEAALRQQGYAVAGLCLTGNSACDLTDPSAVETFVRDVEPHVVIHLAGIAFVAHGNPEEFYRVNVFGTLNLLDALVKLRRPPDRILISSSANVYGTPSVGVIDESVCPQPINHYACSKLSMECMVRTYFERLPIVITRPFNYTGPGQSEVFLIPKIVRHFRDKLPFIELGNLGVSRDFSDVADVVLAYMALLATDVRSEVVNVCSERAIRLVDIIQMMNELAGYQIEVRVNPTLVRLSEVKELLGSSAKLRRMVDLPAPILFHETLRRMYES